MLGHACRHCQAIDAAHLIRLADPTRVRYDVLAAALSARSADRVAVVTCDSTVIELARQDGVLVVNEGHVRGLKVAVRLATANLIAAGATCRLHSTIGYSAGRERGCRLGVCGGARA
jgi:hypothetical protein